MPFFFHIFQQIKSPTTGIPTPEEIWKVVIRHNNDDNNNNATYELMSWIFPNQYTTTEDTIEEYITTIDEINRRRTRNGGDDDIISSILPELSSSSSSMTYIEHTTMDAWKNSVSDINCDYS